MSARDEVYVALRVAGEDRGEVISHLDAFRAEVLAEGLTNTERQFLTFALDLAADQMASRGDEFDDEDEAALAALRRMARKGGAK